MVNNLDRKFFIVIFLFLINIIFLFSDETSDIYKVNFTNYDFLKRSVAIFALSGNINDYNYASQQYQDKINTKLQVKGLFTTKVIENSINIIKIKKPTSKIAIKKELNKICKQQRSDILIFGNSFIKQNKKKITIQVYDFVLNKIILIVNIEIGNILQGEMENATDYINNQLYNFYSIFNKLHNPFITNKYIKNLISLSKNGDSESKLIANNILNQKDALIKYRILFDNINEYFPVFFNKNNIIFINTDYWDDKINNGNFLEQLKNKNKIIIKTEDDIKKEKEELEKRKEFTVTVNGHKFTTKDKILIIAIPPNKYKKLIFTVQKYKKRPINILVFPKEKSKVAIRNISSILRRKMPTRRFYFDIQNILTTTGFTGVGLRFGFAIPQKDSKLDMSMFFDLQFAAKSILFNQRVPDHMERFPDIKITLAMGFKKIFYIKNFIGISIGFKLGVENYFLRYIKIEDKIIVFGKSFPYGYLSFIFTLPIEVELPSFSRFNFFIGVEPTLRISQKFFVYNCKIWSDTFYIDNIDNNYFHKNINSSDKTLAPDIGIDLFFNDMPIVLGLRIKI